jgi:TonB family protein
MIHTCVRVIAVAVIAAPTWTAPAALAQPSPQYSDALRPIPETHTIPTYPLISIRLSEEGTTLMEVHITVAGTVDDCRIVTSSGSDRLDFQACDHVQRVWRWQPPTAGGQPVNVITRVQVKWALLNLEGSEFVVARLIKMTGKLPAFPVEESRDRPIVLNEQASTLLRMHITAKGTAEDCSVVQSSGSALLDQTACDHVKRVWRWTPAIKNDQPTTDSVLIAMTWDTARQQAIPFRLRVTGLLTGCASQQEDVLRQMCDEPLETMFFAVLARSRTPGTPSMCGLRPFMVRETDLAAFRGQVLNWMREHPEVAQQDAMAAARDNAQVIFPCQK